MEAPLLSALVGAIAGLAGGAITAWVAVRNKAVDRTIERDKLWATSYEKTLLDQRLIDYKRLWAITQPTSQRLIAFMTPDSARELSKALTDWYYEAGGILLSASAREAFFQARQSLDAYGKDRATNASRKFSELRSALCTDLNSRSGPSLTLAQLRKFEQESPAAGALQEDSVHP
jgi:hypothetical protein